MPKSGKRDDRPTMAMIVGLIAALGMTAPPGAPAGEDDPLSGTGSAQATGRPKTKHKITIKAEIEIETVPAAASETLDSAGAGGGSLLRSKLPPKPGLPRDTSKLHLGIIKRPGLFAAKEIFYEDKDGLAVVQGDMVVGKVATLQKNLVDKMAKLARFVASSASSALTEDEKKRPGRRAVRGCRLMDTRKPGRPACRLRTSCRAVR